MLEIIPPMVLGSTINVNNIQTYANGSFTMFANDSEGACAIILFNNNGIPKISAIATLGAMFSNGSYILLNELHALNLQGALYSASGKLLTSGFNNFQIFENNWYVLTFDNTNILYNNKHQEIARNFVEAKVFKTDYALRSSQSNQWDFYSIEGKQKHTITNIYLFLGNNHLLKKVSKYEDIYQLFDHSNNIVIKEKICSYINYSNKCFVIETVNGWKSFFDYKGKEQSRSLCNNNYLPDGTIIEKCTKKIEPQENVFDAIYKTKQASYHVVAGHYYFVTEHGKTKFFKDFKKEIPINGTIAWHNQDVVLIIENFANNKVKYRLFTHAREVFNSSNTALIQELIRKFYITDTEKKSLAKSCSKLEQDLI